MAHCQQFNGNNEDRSRRCKNGQALIEFTLLAPWLLFLFVGALDMGFFAYALISTQNAARAVAQYASATSALYASPDSRTATFNEACYYALEELRGQPNVTPTTTCSSGTTVSSAAPVALCIGLNCNNQSVTGADGASAAQVTLTYLTIQMVPIPNVLGAQFTLRPTVQMRIRD